MNGGRGQFSEPFIQQTGAVVKVQWGRLNILDGSSKGNLLGNISGSSTEAEWCFAGLHHDKRPRHKSKDSLEWPLKGTTPPVKCL